MTQEEKDLLLKDLCARLPYGVKVIDLDGWEFTVKGIDGNSPLVDRYSRFGNTYYTVGDGWKPYLRPMSDITKEERNKYESFCEHCMDEMGHDFCYDTIESFDYLISIHIDYRGLIPMGLALEAPNGMYTT